jgi:hypothetical protein
MIGSYPKQAGTLNVSKSPDNFSRRFPQGAWKAALLMSGTVSFSRITFPSRVCHFVFGKRRRMAVFLT